MAGGERRGRMISGNNGGEAESLLFLEAEAGDETQGICHSSAVDKGKSSLSLASYIIFSNGIKTHHLAAAAGCECCAFCRPIW